MSKGQTRPIRFEHFRIGQSLSNRIESDGRFEFELNLEASRVPRIQKRKRDEEIITYVTTSATLVYAGSPGVGRMKREYCQLAFI